MLSVNPSPRPFLLPPVVGPLSRIVTPRAARINGGVLAAPELLTLSVTHFHFIICPFHPRITPCPSDALMRRRDPAMETR